MGICKDSAITYLKRLGYNVVRHPREDIAPLQLIGMQAGSVSHLGDLDQLVVQPVPLLPEIRRGEAAADINGQQTDNLQLAVGLTLLNSILASLGGEVGVKASYEKARSVQFEFVGVLNDSVKPLSVGAYLREAQLDAENKILKEYVLGNGRLFVITKTARSQKFTVQAQAKDGAALALDVPAVGAAVGGSVKVTGESQRSSRVTYEGAKSLVFGFQCFEIGVEGGAISLVDSKPGSVALSYSPAGEVVGAAPTLLDLGGLLTLQRST